MTAARRCGWTALPVYCVRRPRCTGKLKDLRVRPHGAVRCAKCGAVMYVLAFLPLGLAFLAETTADEMVWLNTQHFTAAETLAFFGCPAFPYLAA